MPGGSHFFKDPKTALGDEGTTAAAVPDEINHKDSPALELRELEGTQDPLNGWTIILDCFFPGRSKPVKVERGINFPEIAGVVVEGVDAVNLNQEAFHVLDRHLQAHCIARLEVFLVFGKEIDIDAILERLHLPRSDHGKPFLGIPNPVDELGLGQDWTQVIVAKELVESVKVGVALQEMQEKFANEWFLISQGWNQNDVLKALAETNVPGSLL